MVSKTIEKLIRNRWIEYLDKGELSERDLGARRERKNVSNLLCYYDSVSKRMQGRPGCVYSMYFRHQNTVLKVFESVSFEKLVMSSYVKRINGPVSYT